MTATQDRSRWYATGILAAVCLGATLVNQPTSYFADARFEYAFEPERGIRQLGALWQSSGGLGRIAGTEHGPVPILTFWALRSMGFGPDLAQHLWHGLLLAVAAIGAASVVAHFRPRWGIWHVAAGIAFAFNPLSLGLFTNSVLFLASVVVAPWMQLAVLKAGRREQLWKWAAVLALCVIASLPTELPGTLFNLAFLVPTALYVVWVERSCTLRSMATFVVRSGALMTLTISFVIIRTIQSLGDLVSRLVLSEDPALVSISTSYSESVRGMGSWLAYLRFGSVVPRPQFAPLIETPLIVAATFAVPIGAVVFLVKSDWRPRFLFAALAPLSLVVVVGLYPFPLTPWGGIVTRLNEIAPATSAFRNALKAGAPMILAFAVLFGGLVATTVECSPRRARVVIGLSWVALLMASSIPVWTLNLYPPNRRLDSVPSYWHDASDWLNEQAADGAGRVLILPGSTATTYRWGYVGDDIFTALLTVPFLRQGAFPASTAEANSVLTALDRSIADPEYPVDAQLDVLRRLGVRYIVLRNDLAWQATQRPRPARLNPWRQNPELLRVAAFGQLGEFTTDGTDNSVEASAERLLPPVEIYELNEWQPIVRAVPARAPLLMSGDGQGWMSLAANGILDGSRPIMSTADLSPDMLADRFEEGSPLLITDSNGLRRLSATSSGVSASSVLQAGTTGRGVVSLFPGEDQQTTSWIPGVTEVRSSVDSTSRPWFRPENAFDGDDRTAWRTGAISRSAGSWLEVEFDEERPVQQVRVLGEAGANGQFASGEVVVSSGTRYPFVIGDRPTAVTLDGEPTDSIRVVITGSASTGAVSITDIMIDDLDLAERRQVPRDVAVAAANDPELARSMNDTSIGYVFTREIGTGERPVELVLRRRFSVARALDARISGRLQLGDIDRESSVLASPCGDRVLRLDGRDIPIDVKPVTGRPDEWTFSSCEVVRLDAGWHDLGHGEGIAVDQLLILPDGLDVDDLKLPWPERLESSAERMGGVDALIPSTQTGTALAVVSGRATHPGWQANTAQGKQLAAATFDAQTAFALQAAPSGDRVSIRFAPQRSYDVLILGMYIGLGLCIFLVIRRPNRQQAVRFSTRKVSTPGPRPSSVTSFGDGRTGFGSPAQDDDSEELVSASIRAKIAMQHAPDQGRNEAAHRG